jgi:lipid-A-disaccharide synthase
VLYLGGDLTHAVLVAKKLKYPACAYIQERTAWSKFYKKFFVPDSHTQAKFLKNDKVKTVGNLMVDSVADLKKWSPEDNVITLMPGSRTWQIKHMTPLYKKIVDFIKMEMPQVEFQIVNSPFEKALSVPGARPIAFEEASNSELVITIPGTNTARLAALGIPMLVIFPLDNPEVIPLEGIAHFIGMTPYLGPKFKRFLASSVNKKTKFFALPNIKAKHEIVPEMRGNIDPQAAAKRALSLLKDKEKRVKMSRELLKSLGPGGAAEKIVEEINALLQKNT